MTETANRQNRRKFLQGTVTSDKMDKTRVVQVKWATKHKKYNKVVRAASKYKAHDEKNESKTGDVVQIMETRPLSKDKRWIIRSIVKQLSAEQEA
ncbi:MAG: 30S ribosomal protein S17 [Candidatus Omnitrophica bacterium]|nr:30S ribosomal protein S17 [Candidatus Omnitrophota bacterium]MBU1995949.1 30S ribosomal protein S17 [Candidatus Omnitrophota bacterium]